MSKLDFLMFFVFVMSREDFGVLFVKQSVYKKIPQIEKQNQKVSLFFLIQMSLKIWTFLIQTLTLFCLAVAPIYILKQAPFCKTVAAYTLDLD